MQWGGPPSRYGSARLDDRASRGATGVLTRPGNGLYWRRCRGGNADTRPPGCNPELKEAIDRDTRSLTSGSFRPGRSSRRTAAGPAWRTPKIPLSSSSSSWTGTAGLVRVISTARSFPSRSGGRCSTLPRRRSCASSIRSGRPNEPCRSCRQVSSVASVRKQLISSNPSTPNPRHATCSQLPRRSARLTREPAQHD